MSDNSLGLGVSAYWAVRGIRRLHGKGQQRQALAQQEADERWLLTMEMTWPYLEAIVHAIDNASDAESQIRAHAVENGMTFESALVATYFFKAWPRDSRFYGMDTPKEVFHYLAPHPRRFEVMRPGLTLEQAKALAPYPAPTEADLYVLQYVQRWLRDPRPKGQWDRLAVAYLNGKRAATDQIG